MCIYIQQVVSCMISSLESSETVTIILYNRYNSNASYAIVARRRREREKVDELKREVYRFVKRYLQLRP